MWANLYRDELLTIDSDTNNLVERWHKKMKRFLGLMNRFPVVIQRLYECIEQALGDMDDMALRATCTFAIIQPPKFLVEMAKVFTSFAVEAVEKQLAIPTTSFSSIDVSFLSFVFERIHF